MVVPKNTRGVAFTKSHVFGSGSCSEGEPSSSVSLFARYESAPNRFVSQLWDCSGSSSGLGTCAVAGVGVVRGLGVCGSGFAGVAPSSDCAANDAVSTYPASAHITRSFSFSFE